MSLDPKSFEVIRRMVLQESAISLAEGKEYLVEARLRPILASEGVDSLKTLAKMLESNSPGLLCKVVEALTTNETSFFRDVYPFDALRETVLPEALERNADTRSLNIWSAASSSGQEPISLALTLLHHFPELSSWDVKILATDINQIMVQRCREGLYSELEVSRGLPPEMLGKYFRRQDDRWKVSDKVLDLIEYKQLNLSHPLPAMPAMDVIFLRNVLIYFDPDIKAQILTDAKRRLKPGGVLFLGTAEHVSGLCAGFDPCPFPKATAFRLAA